MAKTTGPLFSLEASGTVGNTVTYSRWKGRSYVRRRVIPLNPFAETQVDARNRIRALANAQTWAKQTTTVSPTATPRDEDKIRAVTPDGYAWNGFLVQKGIGTNADAYAAAELIYDAFTTEKAAWIAAADALVPPMLPASQQMEGGLPATALTSGKVFFIYRHALYLMGLVPEPGATPPTYVAS